MRVRMRARIVTGLACAVMCATAVQATTAAAAGPFACTTSTDFIVDGTEIFDSPQTSAPAWTKIGVATDLLNALGYDPVNGYLYAFSQSANVLYQINSAGVVTALGPVAGLTALPVAASFDPSGNMWLPGPDVAYEIDVTTLTVIRTLALTEPAAAHVDSLTDWTYDYGAMWGRQGNELYDVNLTTGKVTSKPVIGAGGTGTGDFNYAWTYENGDLGFIEAGLSVDNVFRVGGVASATPVSTALPTDAPNLQSGDGTSCLVGPHIVTSSVPGGTYGAAYSHVFNATGGSGSYTWAVAGGALPPGLTLSPTGLLIGTPTHAGTYTFDVQASDAATGASSEEPETVEIAPAPLTAVVTGSQTYGGTGKSFAVAEYTGLTNGDTSAAIAGSLTGCATTVASSASVGSSAGTISGCTGLSDSNYAITYSDGGFTVKQAPLTAVVTGSQTYGGTGKSFAVTEYTGLTNGDTSSAIEGSLTGCATTVAPSASVGSSAGTITGCGGLSDSNYAITYSDGGFTVKQAPLTAVVAGGQTYGGTRTFTVAYYSGLTNGDTYASVGGSLTGCTSSAPDAVGSYPGSISGCSGLNDSNYSISYSYGSFYVTPAPLTAAVTGSQTYGGTGKAFTVAEYTGLTNGDTSAAIAGSLTGCTTTVAASAPAGSNAGTISGCTGLSDSNYAITYSDGGFTVKQAPLTAVVTGSETYGGTGKSFAVAEYTGLTNGDTYASVGGSLTGCTSSAPDAVGSYPGTISGCSGLSDSNYAISYSDGGFHVTPAPLTAVVTGSQTYGGTGKAFVVAHYTGLTNGDAPAAIGGSLSGCTTTVATSAPAGSNAGTISGCTGLGDPNYAITYSDGGFTVKQAPLTAVVTGSQAYGAAAKTFALAHYTGLTNGDTSAAIAGALTGCTSSAPDAVGSYAGTISGCGGLTDPNYAITYGDGGFTVTPVALQITASSASIPRGTTVPAITASYAGFVNHDTAASLTHAPVCTTTATATSAAGVYPTNCAEAADSNYTITYFPGKITITQGSTSLAYTGPVSASTSTPLVPTAALSSVVASCQSGQPVVFTLNANPTNGAAGPYTLGSATTTSAGVATGASISTANWQTGTYTITATYAGTAGCLGSTASATLAVTTPGLAATGLGTFSVPGAGSASFSFSVARALLVPGGYLGSLTLVNEHRWQFIANVTSYSKSSSLAGNIAGTGSLYYWQQSLNFGLGGWALAGSNVAYTAHFTAKLLALGGTFDIQIAYTPVAPQPSPLPNSTVLEPFSGGAIVMS